MPSPACLHFPLVYKHPFTFPCCLAPSVANTQSPIHAHALLPFPTPYLPLTFHSNLDYSPSYPISSDLHFLTPLVISPFPFLPPFPAVTLPILNTSFSPSCLSPFPVSSCLTSLFSVQPLTFTAYLTPSSFLPLPLPIPIYLFFPLLPITLPRLFLPRFSLYNVQPLTFTAYLTPPSGLAPFSASEINRFSGLATRYC